MRFDHLIISISAKVSYLIKNYHYLITPILDLRTLEKTLIQNAAVRPKTQPRPRENPDMLPEMLGAIRTQGTRIRTARLGSDSVVCNGDLARLRVVLNLFSQTHDAYTGSEGVPSTVEMV